MTPESQIAMTNLALRIEIIRTKISNLNGQREAELKGYHEGAQDLVRNYQVVDHFFGERYFPGALSPL